MAYSVRNNLKNEHVLHKLKYVFRNVTKINYPYEKQKQVRLVIPEDLYNRETDRKLSNLEWGRKKLNLAMKIFTAAPANYMCIFFCKYRSNRFSGENLQD